MKINKVSEFILNDDNDNEIRVKHMDDSWHIVVDDESIFSFVEEEASNFVSLFSEIGKM